jgi:4a-hydroxytetrahydrobiopterin dehydratase
MTATFGVEHMSHPAGWTEVDGRLMREFSFENFLDAKAFIDAVSHLCEAQQHHAELHFGWGYAIVETFSHDTNSITERDHRLATAINDLEGAS